MSVFTEQTNVYDTFQGNEGNTAKALFMDLNPIDSIWLNKKVSDSDFDNH